jgi:hypothetical protein
MITLDEFTKIFSIPREPATMLTPGQHFELQVPKGKKILITDIYIENLGNGASVLSIQEQTGPNSFELRYRFSTAANQVTIINYTTGLKLGDLQAIKGTIRIVNDQYSKGNILPRVNGVFIG